MLELAFSDIVTVKAIGLINTDARRLEGLLAADHHHRGVRHRHSARLRLHAGRPRRLARPQPHDEPAPLVEGVRTGAVNSIMFPENPVANAPRIISDLRTIFPPYEGAFLIGPMAKLGWGTPTLVTVSLGVIIEIPGNIAIVGVLKVALPTEDAPLIVIQVELRRRDRVRQAARCISSPALFESRIVFLTLEGEMGAARRVGRRRELRRRGRAASIRASIRRRCRSPRPRRIAVSLLNTAIARIRTEDVFRGHVEHRAVRRAHGDDVRRRRARGVDGPPGVRRAVPVLAVLFHHRNLGVACR